MLNHSRTIKIVISSSYCAVSITVLCSLPGIFTPSRYTVVWIKNCSKSTSVIKVATMKIPWCHVPRISSETEVFYEKYGRFPFTQGKPSRATTKLMLNKDEWNTKEDTDKSLKNALHVPRYAKRYLSGWSNVEQWKNQAGSLSCYSVMLVWRHQAVS